jgi:predicted DsbA family dithiol-disulfide isomerase
MPQKLVVQVWSDVACPWCYIGKRRLEAALRQFDHASDIGVLYRSFELDPSAPRVPAKAGGHAEMLARKYGMSLPQAEEKLRQMTDLGKKENIDFHFDRLRHGNTFDAHRLIHMADEQGLQGAMKERLMRAYFSEGEAMNDTGTLARLAGEVGLDVAAARAMLTGKAFAEAVRADEETAHEAGIHGVPFFLIGRYGVSGAQPAHFLAEALAKAWGELPPEGAEAAVGEGAACGPDECA